MSWLDDNAGWLARAERWRPRVVEPLRLRVWFMSPVAWDGYDPIAIEGALQFLVVIAETGQMPDDVFAGFDEVSNVDIPVPIEDVEIGGRRIACASVGIPPRIAVETVRWRRKRARSEQMGVDKLMINGGPFKAINLPISTLATPWLDFYVRGDRELILRLCDGLQGIARDSTRGLGSVLGVEVDTDEANRSLVYKACPQRVLPIVMDGGDYDTRSYDPDSFESREAGVRAPYWHIRNRTDAVVPSLRISRMAA